MDMRVLLLGIAMGVLAAALGCQAPGLIADPEATRATMTIEPTATPIPGERQKALVLHIVDGDTIVVDLEGERRSVRYIGIDTPETHHPTDGADYWGFEATKANRALVGEGRVVVLQRDVSETDIYDRLLRYVWVDDTLVNAELVRMGLARVLFYEPDTLYRHEIKAAEAEALDAERGLYGPKPTPPAEKPLLYKGAAWTVGTAKEGIILCADPVLCPSTTILPANIEVRVVDAFWVAEDQTWWYWVGVQGFNGWTTVEQISRDAPEEKGPEAPSALWAYDQATIQEESEVRARPDADSERTGVVQTESIVQVDGLSWDPQGGNWWYRIDSTTVVGWVLADRLDRATRSIP
jgi:endonuclease YncB( thermonuclease family)